MDGQEELIFIKVLLVFAKLLFIIWLISWLSGSGKPKIKTEGALGEAPQGKDTVADIWNGDGPDAFFKARLGSASGQEQTVDMHVTALCGNLSGQYSLKGLDRASAREVVVPVEQLVTDVWVGEQHYPVETFIKLLRNNHFRRPQIPEPSASASRQKPASVQSSSVPKVEPAPVADPSLEYHDTRRERDRAVRKAGDAVNWRQEGILSLSGYHVGKTNGVKEAVRRRILNALFLVDDLEDVADFDYALQWGAPGSDKRFRKIHDSLSAFKANAEGRHGKHLDMSWAINDWSRDLAYLDETLRPMIHKWGW